MNTSTRSERVTVPGVLSAKSGPSKQKLVCVTAYDFTMAKLMDTAAVDIVLVGDSLGSVVQGLETTIPVTLDEVIYHTRCVTRAVKRALVIADLPFMSYQASLEKALESAGRLLKEGGAAAVKLEGGIAMAETIARMSAVDIPVMGHVGLTPQSYHRMGGHKVQGKLSGSRDKAGTRERIIDDALAVERAGAFACVLESIPAELAAEITEMLSIPTIGIGAGPACDGQILVSTDLLGLTPDFKPKFVKRFAELGTATVEAVRCYGDEVRAGTFPGPEHSFGGPMKTPARARVLKVAR